MKTNISLFFLTSLLFFVFFICRCAILIFAWKLFIFHWSRNIDTDRWPTLRRRGKNNSARGYCAQVIMQKQFLFIVNAIHPLNTLCKSNKQKGKKREREKSMRSSTQMRTRFFYWMMKRPTNKQIKWIGFFFSSVTLFMCIEIEMKPPSRLPANNKKIERHPICATKIKKQVAGQ